MFTKGADAAWLDFRTVPDNFYTLNAAYQRGFMLIRRLLREGDEAGAQHIIHLLRAKAPRKRRQERKEYLVTNRGPVGSGKGTFKTDGGPRAPAKKVARWFAEGRKPPYHSGGALWVSENDVAYSYRQVIAEKNSAQKTAYVDQRDYSPTTNRHIRMLVWALQAAGWEVEQRDFR